MDLLNRPVMALLTAGLLRITQTLLFSVRILSLVSSFIVKRSSIWKVATIKQAQLSLLEGLTIKRIITTSRHLKREVENLPTLMVHIGME